MTNHMTPAEMAGFANLLTRAKWRKVLWKNVLGSEMVGFGFSLHYGRMLLEPEDSDGYHRHGLALLQGRTTAVENVRVKFSDNLSGANKTTENHPKPLLGMERHPKATRRSCPYMATPRHTKRHNSQQESFVNIYANPQACKSCFSSWGGRKEARKPATCCLWRDQRLTLQIMGKGKAHHRTCWSSTLVGPPSAAALCLRPTTDTRHFKGIKRTSHTSTWHPHLARAYLWTPIPVTLSVTQHQRWTSRLCVVQLVHAGPSESPEFRGAYGMRSRQGNQATHKGRWHVSNNITVSSHGHCWLKISVQRLSIG